MFTEGFYIYARLIFLHKNLFIAPVENNGNLCGKRSRVDEYFIDDIALLHFACVHTVSKQTPSDAFRMSYTDALNFTELFSVNWEDMEFKKISVTH